MKNVIFVLLFISLAFESHALEKRYDVPLEDSPGYGQQNAPVTIVEFVDYQ